MRDPKRIPKILKRLEKVWMEHSDLRLAQLIENIFPRINHPSLVNDPTLQEIMVRDPYYLEDEEFISIIEKQYKLIDESVPI